MILGATALSFVAASRAMARPNESDAGKALASAGQISGTVLSADRKPVTGTSVAVVNEATAEIHGTNTNQRGRYSIKGLIHGTYSVIVMDPGGGLLRKEQVNVRPLFRNLVDFITEPEGAPPALPRTSKTFQAPSGIEPISLTGLIRELGGNPIPEAWVTLTPESGTQPSLRARTDVAGKFKLIQVSPGLFRIRVRALGHITWSLGPVRIEAQDPGTLVLGMVNFPLGHPETLENLLVPVEPATPEEFKNQRSISGSGNPDRTPSRNGS